MSAPVQPYSLPGYDVFTEPRLRFGGDPEQAIDIHPLRGLLEHGLFSKGKLAALSDPIRVAIVAPHGKVRHVVELLREMQQRHRPGERLSYLKDYTGFTNIFGVRLTRAMAAGNTIELPAALTQEIADSPKPHAVLAKAMSGALAALRLVRHEFDVAMILIDEQWEAGFRAKDEESRAPNVLRP